MDNGKRKILLVIASIVLIIMVAILIVTPNDLPENEFSAKAFPELEAVAKTTIILDDSLSSYIGNEGFYKRDKFSAEIMVEHKDKVSFDALISKRGATSFSFNKHQFSVSLLNDDGVQVKEAIMDMPKGEDWVLSGPLLDRSMLRNYLAYKTSFEIMGYAPRAQFTELYIKEGQSEPEYKGLYLWLEKIRQGQNRVSIFPTSSNLTETSFIIAKDEYREGDQLFNVYGKELYMYAYQFIDIYPKVTLTEEQINYIGDTITSFERVLYQDKYDIPGEGYEKHIDVDSFIDYFLINEFFMNTDAGHKSTYLHKDVRGLIKLGPVWDFNNAMGNVNTVFPVDSYEGLFMHDRIWFDKLLKDPVFVKRLLTRYEILRQGPLHTESLLEDIDQAYAVIKPYVEKDHQTNSQGDFAASARGFLFNESEELQVHLEEKLSSPVTFDGEIEELKDFIIQRGQWLDENLESISKWTD